MSKFTRRVSASLGALVITAIALMGATPANAAPANIDPGETRSLTVHAFQNGAGTVGDGSAQTGLTGPVEDIPFTAQRVTEIGGETIDLETAEGWTTIAPYLSGTSAFDPAAADTGLVPGGTATSNAAGAAAFGSLPIGLYWVTATLPSPNTQGVVMPPKPFLVALPMPMTDAAGDAVPGQWRYDVHAYPKPVATSSSKTSDAAATAIGDVIYWTVRVNIPAIAAGDSFTRLRVVDTLPTHLRGNIPGYSAVMFARTANDAAYNIANMYTSAWTNNDRTLTFDLTDPVGLDRLKTMPGGWLNFMVPTRVMSLPDNGEIVNNAVVHLNDTEFNVQATQLWGQVRINKVVAGDTTRRLDGAEFQIFRTEQAALDAIAAVNAGNPTVGAISYRPNGDGAMSNTFTTATVGSDAGFVTIPGLKASATGTDYWIVETEAPAGYIRATTPTRIAVTPGVTSVNNVIAEIANVQQTPGTLPVLGSNGMMIATIGGSALLLGGLLVGFISRRRKTEAAEATA